jgi:hypothetical protein
MPGEAGGPAMTEVARAGSAGVAVPAEGPAVPAEELAGAALELARAVAGGGTMWCVAPRWPAHGRHVAVEFVHPVVVGARAMPAVHVEATSGSAAAADTIRLLARPGDVLLVIGPGDDAVSADLLRRAEAWGLVRLAIGAGPRPAAGAAEHVAWLDGADPAIAARSGDVVLCYHLLWELTQIVFEHPGLLGEGAAGAPACAAGGAAAARGVAAAGAVAGVAASADGEAVCITCSDEARLAEVRRLCDGSSAEVVAAGRLERVDVSLVEPVAPGDLVLCHAGVAISLLADAPGDSR